MNLFHVSEDPMITHFEPRLLQFTEKPVVWAVDEAHYPARIMDTAGRLLESTLQFSFIRMRNAQSRAIDD